MVDVACLNDCELQNQLRKLGFSPGPILPSTRKLYEKQLVRLLVSPSSSAMKRPSKLDGPQDSDDSEEINITLKGNITLSTEKGNELKKRFEASTANPKPVDIHCLDYKTFREIRCAARPSNTRIQDETVPQKEDCYGVNQSSGSSKEGFPLGLKLAVLGIFIIVVFVYITVERKPLFG
ncbi:LEM domain-containing protein 1 [Nycticebus coucang]|uniref:LEM domain-containing protein 1 n=1 Tax=Nycticebus coucang TaxID=9470 RepID=UPI00234D1181|nr:LEM domain-containing protein 1 [Nycticebus coucang]